MKGKDWLIGCGIALGCLILLIIIGGYLAYRFYVVPKMQAFMGPTSATPGVLVGAGSLTQTTFYADPRLDSITDIAFGELDSAPGSEIGIAGSDGAVLLDKRLKVKRTVLFPSDAARVVFIDLQHDGVCEYLSRGSWSHQASVLKHDGSVLWKYGGSPGVDDTCAGDVNRNGALEFAVGFNGGGGVHLLDDRGRKLWQMPDANVWHIEMTDVNGDRAPEIVHSNAGGQMTVRDARGAIISQARPGAPAPAGTAAKPAARGIYFSHFSLCHWPAANSAVYALSAGENALWLLDFKGGAVARFDAPKCGVLGEPWGTLVKLKANQPPYLAVVVAYPTGVASVLCIYDRARKLVYQEVLGEPCAAIAAMTVGQSGAQALLVGGGGRVLKYEAAPAQAAP
jgi:hypothetical protein